MSSEWIEKNAEEINLGDQIITKDGWATVHAVHNGESSVDPNVSSVWAYTRSAEVTFRRGTKVMVRTREWREKRDAEADRREKELDGFRAAVGDLTSFVRSRLAGDDTLCQEGKDAQLRVLALFDASRYRGLDADAWLVMREVVTEFARPYAGHEDYRDEWRP